LKKPGDARLFLCPIRGMLRASIEGRQPLRQCSDLMARSLQWNTLFAAMHRKKTI
jgi:hypothetical protein